MLIENMVYQIQYDTDQVNGSHISHTSFIQMISHPVNGFTKVNTKSLKCINRILEDFSTFTNLEVNKNKRSVTFSKICEGNILGFQAKKLPIRYIGITIPGKKKTYN